MDNAYLLCRDIKVPLVKESSLFHDKEAINIAKKRYMKTLQSRLGHAQFSVMKKSVDARDKSRIVFLYTVAVFPEKTVFPARLPEYFSAHEQILPDFSCFSAPHTVTSRPIVVGFGPAGIFCAYALALAGFHPIVLERGSDVDTRSQKVKAYWETGVLDINTNVQFGEGGAGTFSDGKLLTRIHDPLCAYVLQTLVKFGAPKQIQILAKPHVGTDKLRGIVKNIREEIIRLGATVYFNTTLTGFSSDASGNVKSVMLNSGEELPCSALFLCIGHSARDTFEKLLAKKVLMTPKPFSVGVRVEHLQEDIDIAMHGKFAGYEALGHAEYTLSAKKDGRAVYSFCMCPGGTVVASASEQGEIVTNGMSNYARDGQNANSAIAVSVHTKDYGGTVQGAINYQRQIEKAAFALAGADGAAPCQSLGDFLSGTAVHSPSRIMPTYTGKTALCRIDTLFAPEIRDMLAFGFGMFEKHIAGFAVKDAVLTAPETRTSSPVRIERNESRLAPDMKNLYPCGEGAGYAGGIISAAVDGLKSALCFLELQNQF